MFLWFEKSVATQQAADIPSCCTLCSRKEKESLLKCSQENTKLSWKKFWRCGQRLGCNKAKMIWRTSGSWQSPEKTRKHNAEEKFDFRPFISLFFILMIWLLSFWFVSIYSDQNILLLGLVSNKQNLKAKKLFCLQTLYSIQASNITLHHMVLHIGNNLEVKLQMNNTEVIKLQECVDHSRL